MLELILYFLAYFLIIFFLAWSIIFMGWGIVSDIYGAPYVPTRHNIIKAILTKAKLSKNQTFLELGCGDARVLRTAVKKYDVIGTGIDINWYVLTVARLKSYIQNIHTISFIQKNFLNVSYAEYNVIYVFLLPKLLEKVAHKIKAECKKDTLIISHGFKISNWESCLIDKLEKGKFYTYYYNL